MKPSQSERINEFLHQRALKRLKEKGNKQMATSEISSTISWAKKILTLRGYKAYIGAVGLMGWGVYLVTEGQHSEGIEAIMQGLGVFGIRAAIGRQ
jgi:hypothetical protein